MVATLWSNRENGVAIGLVMLGQEDDDVSVCNYSDVTGSFHFTVHGFRASVPAFLYANSKTRNRVQFSQSWRYKIAYAISNELDRLSTEWKLVLKYVTLNFAG